MTMNKTIYEAEFTKMVHDKMREANRFKEYERIPKNRIGGDYWNTYWTIPLYASHYDRYFRKWR